MHLSSVFQRRLLAVLVAGSVVFLLGACGKKDAAATQVIASVDGQEISIHQVNAVLAKARGLAPEKQAQAKVEILGALVEQQLAVNLAMNQKLDRSPDVVNAIETARREILARAALDQVAAALPKPSDDDAQKYYAENPALFSERRVFSLQEIILDKSVPDVGQIRSYVASAKSMEDVASWLRGKGVDFKLNGGTRPAEQVPLEMLPTLQRFKDGEMGLIEGDDSYVVTRLLASRTQPIPEAKALSAIKVFLNNQHAAEAIKLAKIDMKSKAKIEYFGEFAGGEAAFKARAEQEATAAKQAAAQAQSKAKTDADVLAQQKSDEQAARQAEQDARSKARSEARNQASKDQGSTKIDASNLEKGIKGLK